MRRPIDVDESLQPAAIPGRLLNELCAHSLEARPEECCGLIMGNDRERFRWLVRCHNEMSQRHREDPVRYPRDNHAAFYMRETDYLRAVEQAEAAGDGVTVVYHSHVDVGPYLSELDLEYAENPHFPFPDADHIVASVSKHGRAVSAALFQRDRAGGSFTGRVVVSAGP